MSQNDGFVYTGINFHYCTNLYQINDAIRNKDPEWLGLTDASDIISVTHNYYLDCYVVVWKIHLQD